MRCGAKAPDGTDCGLAKGHEFSHHSIASGLLWDDHEFARLRHGFANQENHIRAPNQDPPLQSFGKPDDWTPLGKVLPGDKPHWFAEGWNDAGKQYVEQVNALVKAATYAAEVLEDEGCPYAASVLFEAVEPFKR